MVRVAILGATGYTARDLLDLLLRHPEVEVTALATRSEENLHVARRASQLAWSLGLASRKPLTA